MKLNKIERGVTRYQVSFTSGETRRIAADPRWHNIIRPHRTARGNLTALAMLTKVQINEVCDLLGVNGREWLLSKGVT